MNVAELLDAWRINNVVNLELLKLCADEDFELKPGKGKTIRSNFVHIIGMRRAHVEDLAKKEADRIPKLDWQLASRAELIAALNVSHDVYAEVLSSLANPQKPRRWNWATFFAYSVAHEAHHRSQIELALRLNGREPPVADLYRLWDWPKK